MDRRAFLKATAGMGLAASANPALGAWGHDVNAAANFGLHPFIEAHPEAVFIRQTHVPAKDDAEAKRREGFELGRRIFTRRDFPGLSSSDTFAIKPNLTATLGKGRDFAIITDPYVVEGLIDGTAPGGREAGTSMLATRLNVDQPGIGYQEMSQRSGVHYSDNDSPRAPAAGSARTGWCSAALNISAHSIIPIRT